MVPTLRRLAPWLRAITLVLPSFVVVMVLTDPGLQYKEFVYVDGQEIERIDLYYVIPGVLKSFIPFLVVAVLLIADGIYSKVKRAHRRVHDTNSQSDVT